MKSKINQLIATTLSGLIILAVSPFSYAAEPRCKEATVLFKKGADSATYQNKLKDWECISYNFVAQKGQTLTVSLTTKNNVEAILYNHNDFVQGEPYILPKAGKYDIRVLQPKAAAIKNQTAFYTIKIKIK